MRTYAKYGAVLIGIYLLVAYKGGATLISNVTSGSSGVITALQGRSKV